MRYVCFQVGDKVSYGWAETKAGIEVVTELAGAGPEQFMETGNSYPLAEVRLLAPAQPSKVICVGLNYQDHAAELGMAIPTEPLLFLKPPSCIIGPGETVQMPTLSADVQYEAELAIVISRVAKEVSPEDAAKYIWGYTCFNDVTARDLQARDGQWTRAKGFDTFGPLGPWIESEFDPEDVEVSCYLNEQRVQHSWTSEFIFTVPEILAQVTAVMTLYPGDVISTGTPAGVGPVADGDVVSVEISGIGRLTNTCRRR